MYSNVVIVHDERAEGCIHAPGRAIFPVNEEVPLSALVGNLQVFCQAGGYRLILICHGIGWKGRGGLGLELCKEDLTLATVPLLAPLSGLFSSGVLIDACQAAGRQKGARNVHGDGRFLCSKIAQTLDTTVQASNAGQSSGFRIVNGIDYLDEIRWQGKVLTWDARGTYLGKTHGGRKAPADRMRPPARH